MIKIKPRRMTHGVRFFIPNHSVIELWYRPKVTNYLMFAESGKHPHEVRKLPIKELLSL